MRLPTKQIICPKGKGAYPVWYLFLLLLHVDVCQVVLKLALVFRAGGEATWL